jgi:hypothetical protein
MTTEEKTKPVKDLFEQATKNYEQALKTGLKLQEESAKLFLGVFNQVTAPADFQKKVKAISDEIIPQTQKAVDEGLKLIEQNSRTGMDLLKKAASAWQATTLQDAQGKSLALYEGYLNAVRDSASAVTQATAKAAESWLGYVRKSTEPPAVGKS